MHDPKDLLEATTRIAVAMIADGRHQPGGIEANIASIYGALAATANAPVAEPGTEQPEGPIEGAVTVRKSLASKDHIISMIDGKPYKTLRRHLATNGMTPESYRERYGLKPDYPMVAEAYSESRRAMAKKIGLGRKPGDRPTAG